MLKQISRQRVTVVALVLSSLMGYASIAQSGGDHDGARSSISSNAGDACVRETAWMRRNHMELLQHDRDRTLQLGIRPVEGSIKGCVECHTQQDDHGNSIAINAEDQFCSSCHAFTSVSIDCFECHATKPDQPRIAVGSSAK
ncbi:MAG: Hdr-like menaquinol oxidoreductase cytochrome c subunit [Gammaproteobacteria bacterium]|uniref:Hdr-like menaquinol oxidoreductase cytochrome c subunit n=1 Tax=Candidatus Thiopontia autotrophica TaxID=2841688 RepID=A0A8J6NY81_9GAMM|nr:Hdr-like menaquinol oxidoreductase cytochrome c subunit [Candidatus Thiopontia autotrophica]MBL6969197.1 Hdr-like menaquinol oxidoreductase cytochrome c subunit [Gammaproteobacteria bacterium]